MPIWADGILAQRLELAMNATGCSSEKSEASASQANAGANAPRSIRSARELFESLRAADILTRLSSLKAVQAQPQAAVGFGTWQELDLIDVLLTEASKFEGTLEWLAGLGCSLISPMSALSNSSCECLPKKTNPVCSFVRRSTWQALPWPHSREHFGPFF